MKIGYIDRPIDHRRSAWPFWSAGRLTRAKVPRTLKTGLDAF